MQKTLTIGITGAIVNRRGTAYDVIYQDQIVAVDLQFELALCLALSRERLGQLLQKNNNVVYLLKSA